jgi:hypothetical protein
MYFKFISVDFLLVNGGMKKTIDVSKNRIFGFKDLLLQKERNQAEHYLLTGKDINLSLVPVKKTLAEVIWI